MSDASITAADFWWEPRPYARPGAYDQLHEAHRELDPHRKVRKKKSKARKKAQRKGRANR